MEAATRRHAITRVGYIEGYVAALRRKIEKDEGVIEVLRKTHTLRRSRGQLRRGPQDGLRRGLVGKPRRSRWEASVAAIETGILRRSLFVARGPG